MSRVACRVSRVACLIIFCVLGAFSSCARAEVAITSSNFPDYNFRTYISENFDTNSDGVLSDEEISAVTSIDVRDKNISRVNGVEYFSELERFYIPPILTRLDLSSNTKINYVHPIYSGNSGVGYRDYALISLNVSGTAITRIIADDYIISNLKSINASNCTSLTRIHFIYSNLTELNLTGCSSITNIDIQNDNGTLTILNVDDCVSLERLSCYGNALTELNLKNNTSLTRLECYNNSLAMLDLSNNTALTYLRCEGQKISGQKVTTSGNSSYPYQYDFTAIIPAESLSGIVSDSVHGFNSNGDTIDTTFDASRGVAMFAYTPAEIDYEYATGYGSTTMSVNISISSGGVVASSPVIMNATLSDAVINMSYYEELYATGTKPIAWRVSSGSLPDGLELLGEGIIRGTPTETGSYSFALQALNNAGYDEVSYSMTVGSSSIISAPNITTGAILTEATANVSYGNIIKATGTRPVIFSLVSGDFPDGLNFNSEGGISGAPSSAGVYAFTIQAQNSGGIVSKDFSLTVNAAPENTKPAITTAQLEDGSVNNVYSFQLSATGTPPITWKLAKGKLPKNISLSSSGLLSGLVPKAGKTSLTITATNAYGTASKIFTLNNLIPPEITKLSLTNATVNKSYSNSISKKGSKVLTWTLEGNLPKGLTFNKSTGRFSGKPLLNGTYNFRVMLQNSVGDDVKNYTLNVNAIAAKITPAKLAVGTVGKSYRATIKATGTTPITLSLAGYLPDGLTFNANTGAISGIPKEECTDRKLTLTASNMAGDVVKEFYLTVKPVAPKITTTALKAGKINEEYSATFSASGTAPITWDAENLPLGLEISEEGIITGTPGEFGTFNVNVIATNSAKAVSKKFKLVIYSPPSFEDNILADAVAGKNYNAKFNVVGSKPVSFSLSDGALPKGMRINASGSIAGTPLEAGEFSFTVTAKNSAGSSSQEFTLNVAAVAPKISGNLKNGTVGQIYSAILKASGTAPISWGLDGGVPSGITFNNGIFSGTPAESFDEYITITATNAGGTDAKIFRLVIKDRKATNNNKALPELEDESENIFAGEIFTVAELPIISVDKSGMYDFVVKVSDDIPAGAKLIWRANSSEPSNDDDIAEFYNSDGEEIENVPSDKVFTVSAWLNPKRIYVPTIAIRY